MSRIREGHTLSQREEDDLDELVSNADTCAVVDWVNHRLAERRADAVARTMRALEAGDE